MSFRNLSIVWVLVSLTYVFFFWLEQSSIILFLHGSLGLFLFANWYKSNNSILHSEKLDLKQDQSEYDLQQAVKKLNSSKSAMLVEYASSLIHEINTPLSVINIYANSILKESTLYQHKSCIEHSIKITQTTEKIQKIMNGMRNFVKDSETDSFENATLHAILTEAIDMVQLKTQRINCKVTLDGDFENIELFCRPIQLSQVFVNLFNNSLDAIEFLNQKWIKVSLQIEADAVLIKFTDSGFGIPKVLADRIFNPFFSTKEASRGTGLGLSICSDIINSHGGNIKYIPDQENTVFQILLPIAKRVDKAA